MLDRRSFLSALVAVAPATALAASGGRWAPDVPTSAGSPSSRGPARGARSVYAQAEEAPHARTNGSPSSRGRRRRGSRAEATAERDLAVNVAEPGNGFDPGERGARATTLR